MSDARAQRGALFSRAAIARVDYLQSVHWSFASSQTKQTNIMRLHIILITLRRFAKCFFNDLNKSVLFQVRVLLNIDVKQLVSDTY